MQIFVDSNPQALGERAAAHAVDTLRAWLGIHNEVALVVATGASQFETIKNLVTAPDIDWGRVTVFHLDEYIGVPESHPASFRRYLHERFVSQLPTPLKAFHAVNGEGDPDAECARLNALIEKQEIALALIGIGENAPPADFETDSPFIVVELDEACRRQQMGEG